MDSIIVFDAPLPTAFAVGLEFERYILQNVCDLQTSQVIKVDEKHVSSFAAPQVANGVSVWVIPHLWHGGRWMSLAP